MEGFNLPSLAVPMDLLQSIAARGHRKVGDQFPVDPISSSRLAPLLSMNNSKIQIRILLLLSDRRKHADAAIADLQNRLPDLTSVTPFFYLNAMQPLDRNLLHLIGDGVLAISGQPVHAGAHHEMRSHLLCRAEQFVNITLPIADVDTAARLVEQRCGLAQVLQPAKSFDFDRYPSGIDLLLQRVASVKLIPAPELIALSPRGIPSVVTAKLECISRPQTIVCCGVPSLFLLTGFL